MTVCTTIERNRASFAGIDFHKRFSVVTLGDSSGKTLAQETLPNDEHMIRKFFLRHSPLKCAIENSRANNGSLNCLDNATARLK